MTLGVRAAILDQDGRVFLVRHSYVPGWHFPGGAAEVGETMLTALAREVLEEGAIEIIGEPLLHGIFFNQGASRRDHVLVYVVRGFRVIGPRRPDWEIVESGFFPVTALPEGTTRSTRARLDEIATGTQPSQIW